MAHSKGSKSRIGDRHYDGDDQSTHHFDDIPNIFSQPGRSSGKSNEIWFQDNDYHVAHTYILMNCEELNPFERYVRTIFHLHLHN